MLPLLRIRERGRAVARRRAGGAALGMMLLAGGLTGCGSSSMMIYTRPENAAIIVDGQEIGRSPVLYHGSNGWDGGVEVRAKLEGYQEAVRHVPREPNWYYLTEFLLLPPALPWGWYLPDSATLFLEPAVPGGSPPSPPAKSPSP